MLVPEVAGRLRGAKRLPGLVVLHRTEGLVERASRLREGISSGLGDGGEVFQGSF